MGCFAVLNCLSFLLIGVPTELNVHQLKEGKVNLDLKLNEETGDIRVKILEARNGHFVNWYLSSGN